MRILMTALATLAFLGAAQAQTTPGIDTAARHVAILDYDTGRLLYCDECDVPMPPASMSKLMTMLIVAEELKAGRIRPDTRFKVSEKAWRHGAQSDGSHMFLELNSEVRVDDLIRGVIIVSANDACIALAEGIAGSEAAFVDRMNERARELGLTTASFANTTGLPAPNHLISSGDLARLAATIIREHGDLYALYSQPAFTYNGKTQENRNPLLGRYAGADGVKTGHTAASGYGLVGSAVSGEERRIIAFNGLPTMAARSAEAQRIMDAAFNQFALRTLYDAGQAVGEAEVWLGGRKTVPLLAAEEIEIAGPRAALARVRSEIVYQAPAPAPIAKGDQVAELVVTGPGMAEQRFPLIAGEKVGRLNVFGRAVHGLAVTFGGS